MRFRRQLRAPLAAIVAAAVLVGLTQAVAWADPPAPTSSAATAAEALPYAVPLAERAALLGTDWKASADAAWTTSGDADGFHILTAHKKDGYAWHTAASLSEPGFDADAWIGNVCVTGSGRRAVVVYAPRTFTNKPNLMARGGFTAVVDLASGRVTKLQLTASLSYYNPGCGPGESVVLTQSGGDDRPGTRLFRLDASTAELSKPIEVKGQVTSAVPVADGAIASASGAEVIKIDARGGRRTLVRTDGVPYRLTPDGDGGLAFLDKRGVTAKVKRITAAAVAHPKTLGARAAVLAQGLATETGLTRSAGTVYVTGATKPTAAPLPSTVRRLASAPKDVTVSTRGEAVLTHTAWADGKGTLLQPGEAAESRTVTMSLTTRATGRDVSFTVDPAFRTSVYEGQGRDASPGLLSGSGGIGKPSLSAAAEGDPSNPVEAERTCSVPRNDPRNQAMQPKPRQVEWAVDMAVKGVLNTHISRPADWKNLGMPAYQPQTLFLNPAMEGGGRAMAQVMLGVTTQESNMWQAARSAVPGVTASPLIGNYYGIDLYDGDTTNDWDINFAEADCGYGITQITDHMRMAGREDGHGGTAWEYQKQRAAALDYTANIAAGLQTLVSKWNETRAAGMIANHGTTGRPENWYFALWAYNSGFHPNAGDGSPWGLGWANNPANPEWDAGRLPFMENAAGGEDASAAARPQNWPYQEKVLGFAAHPPSFLESPGVMVPAFRPATWNGTSAAVTVQGSALYNRARLKAPEAAFCDSSNNCDPSRISDGSSNDSAASGPCGREDFQCWWNKPVTWKTDCVDTCGYEFIRFGDTSAEEADGTAYPPNCTTASLPDNALVVDDVPAGTPVVRSGCTNSWTNSGSFSFDFSSNAVETVYPAKVDLHQLGAGFGGHFYFGHTRADDSKGQRLKITGTWKLNQSLTGRAKVLVHLPDHGAQTKYAKYQIKTGRGTRTKTISQPGSSNRWVELGIYAFDNVPEVALDTITSDGTGDEDVAFDAVAFVPGRYPTVDITLPEPDANAANVEWDSINGPMTMEAPQYEPAIPDNADPGVGAFTGKPAKLKGYSCAPANSNGISGCSRLLTTKKQMTGRPVVRKETSTLSASGFGDIVSWCTNTIGSHRFTRFEGCFHTTYEYTAIDTEDGSVFAEVAFDVFQQVKLNQKSGDFEQQMEVWPIGTLDPKLVNITLDMRFNCFDEGLTCSSEPEQWDTSLTWTPGDAHIARATKKHHWSNSGSTKGWDILGFNWKFQGYTPIAGPTAVKVYAQDLLPQCDNFAINNTAGCSFGAYEPTYQFNSAKYPAAAAHAWLIQNALSPHAGSKKFKSPMNYLPNGKNQYGRDTDANRKVICPRSYDYHPDTTLLPELVSTDTPDVKSCDEFAFAGSYQSAGMPAEMNGRNPIDSGDGCVQTYATRATQGTWKLYDDDRYDPPTFNEVCGRSSMSQWMNGGSMNRFGGFASYFRILDSDAYWVDIPGFDGCSAAGPKIECTMHP
ncbi:hypothetical protein [Streptomyces sp. NPDC127072]|uniref:golvesin C-terminal-like domain-containing protein n=1 Tax=Streptomyces sp. NPDC127072 TaxID=3347129 RepID=UPI00365831A7